MLISTVPIGLAESHHHSFSTRYSPFTTLGVWCSTTSQTQSFLQDFVSASLSAPNHFVSLTPFIGYSLPPYPRPMSNRTSLRFPSLHLVTQIGSTFSRSFARSFNLFELCRTSATFRLFVTNSRNWRAFVDSLSNDHLR